ncbi:hypothetical protein Emag_004283 [Eimeria magna]
MPRYSLGGDRRLPVHRWQQQHPQAQQHQQQQQQQQQGQQHCCCGRWFVSLLQRALQRRFRPAKTLQWRVSLAAVAAAAAACTAAAAGLGPLRGDNKCLLQQLQQQLQQPQLLLQSVLYIDSAAPAAAS